MVVNDFLIFRSSDYVDVSVGNEDSLRVIGQVLKLFKLLYFVVFALNIVQEAMVFLDRENRNPSHRFMQIIVQSDD